jgi:L,D-transpeptidase ErfK/SrfK
LLDVARDNDLGILELMAANRDVDPWVPGSGVPLVLPTAFILPDAPRRGIVINLAELRIFYFAGRGKPTQTWPIGIGREYFTTPLGTTRVVRKETDPSWVPTATTRSDDPGLPAVVPPGPDNPMGRFALYLGWPTYAIHGTNKPWGMGRRVSRGCIRLYREDIEVLYGLAGVGTPVTVVNEAAKLGWRDGELYLEVHPSKSQLDELEESGRFTPEDMPSLNDRVLANAGEGSSRLDWRLIAAAVRDRRGVPVRVTRPANAALDRDLTQELDGLLGSTN